MFVNATRVAGQTGYSRSHISRVFGRKTQPSFSCLVAISDALGITIDELARRIKERKIIVRNSRGDAWTRGSRRGLLGKATD